MPRHSGRHRSRDIVSITIDRRSLLYLTIPSILIAITVIGYQFGAGSSRIPRLALPSSLSADTSLGLIFLTGLSVGGLSCLAVQGGLLASVIASRAVTQGHTEMGLYDKIMPVTLFLGAKIIAYTLLGAGLGLVGSKIPLGLQAWLMVFAGVFMLIVVAQMYDTHPFFRHFAYRPPKALQRLLRARSRQDSPLTPAILGSMTIFIPCGVTLAMEALAISANSPLRGAQIMAAFTLGTSPLFFALGFAATHMSSKSMSLFRPIAATTIALIASMSIMSGARLLGFNTGTATGPVVTASILGEVGGAAALALQEAVLQVNTGSYEPQRIQIKAGLPTRLSLVTDQTEGCIRAFVIPSLGIEKILPATGRETVEIPPVEAGTLDFMCSMGMYTGVIEVVE